MNDPLLSAFIGYQVIASERTIGGPPPPRQTRCKAPIPPPGTGLLGPHAPTAARHSLTCPCSPSVRRSDRRSYFLHGDLLGDVTSAALIFTVDKMSALLRRALPVILTVIGYFNTYRWTSRSRRPHGPRSCKMWPILALGSPQPNSRASRRAPRAATPQAKGRSWPTSPRGRQLALGSPLPAPPRTQAHHPHNTARAPCPHTLQPARSARYEPPCRC